jgi:hypothetical protein
MTMTAWTDLESTVGLNETQEEQAMLLKSLYSPCSIPICLQGLQFEVREEIHLSSMVVSLRLSCPIHSRS